MTPDEIEQARDELHDLVDGFRAFLEWHGMAGTALLPPAEKLAPRVDVSSATPAVAAQGAPHSAAPQRELIPTFPAIAQRGAAPTLPIAPPPLALDLPREERLARLAVIAERVASCTACGLHEKRNKTVFSRGGPMPEVCFVGEGPGEDEDASGLPFVGRAGQLLDKMIGAMGLTSEQYYICNIVKCRPPNNRNPLPAEMAACMPYLTEQIELVRPKAIVVLGNTALKGLCGVEGITKLRGTWRLYRGTIPVMPTYHPSFVLRTQTPQVRREVWNDLLAVLKQLGREAPARGAQNE